MSDPTQPPASTGPTDQRATVTTGDGTVDEGTVPASRPSKLRRFLRDRVAVMAAVVLALIAIMAILAPLIAPYGPLDQDLRAALSMPRIDHWLGTDNLGRDILSRLIHGARISFAASLIAVGVALIIGVPIGLLSGYVGSWLDVALMRVTDAFMALPNIILVIAIIAILGNTLTNAMVALGLVFAPTFIRLVRGEVLAVREELYVDAARVLGLRGMTIVRRHVLPNIVSPVIVQISIMMGFALILEAGLSFIGLGVQPPQASWGSMLASASEFIYRHPFLLIPPGVAITITVLALNLLGDGIRDAVGRGLETDATKTPPPPPPSDTLRTKNATDGRNPDALLTVADLQVQFPFPDGRWRPILDGVDLTIGRGEVLGLVGESGSGKSMTALAIMRLIPRPGIRTAGSISLDGRELTDLSEPEMRAIRGDDVALISQEPMSSLNPAYTIGNQVMEAIRWHRDLSRQDARERAIQLLERVGIPDAAKRFRDYPHQFSGGMAQRVMIAMALSCEPKLLIADEPTTALDVTVQDEVLQLLRGLQQDTGMSVLFVTHDLGVVASICDRAAVMYTGQIVEVGSVGELFTRPQHPYTEGLLRSLPQTAIERGQMHRIPGMVPPPHALPTGCRFAPRCPYVRPQCHDLPPAGPTVANPDRVRCVRTDELDLEGV